MGQKKQYTKFLLGLLVFVGVLVCANVVYESLIKNTRSIQDTGGVFGENEHSSDQEMSAISRGVTRDFSVLDDTGKTIQFSSYRGKPVVLNFWSMQCGPCLAELPAFDHLYKSYGDKVAFLMITSCGETLEGISKVKEFINQHGCKFPVYFDQKDSAHRAYGITHIPVTVMIRADGTVHASYVGRVPDATLEEKIKSLSD